MFKKNDYILMTDKHNPYFLQVGKVELVSGGLVMVTFKKDKTQMKYAPEEYDTLSFSENELALISKTLAFK
jgi:hypothetical protein